MFHGQRMFVWALLAGFLFAVWALVLFVVLRIVSPLPSSHKSCGVFLVLVERHWTCALTLSLRFCHHLCVADSRTLRPEPYPSSNEQKKKTCALTYGELRWVSLPLSILDCLSQRSAASVKTTHERCGPFSLCRLEPNVSHNVCS